jgi:hypothetical protein
VDKIEEELVYIDKQKASITKGNKAQQTGKKDERGELPYMVVYR